MCPPSRPPREELDRLIDEVAWAKTCMIVAAATPPASPARERELDVLRRAIAPPRQQLDEILGRGQSVPNSLIVELRTCELALPKLEAGAILRQGAATPQGQKV